MTEDREALALLTDKTCQHMKYFNYDKSWRMSSHCKFLSYKNMKPWCLYWDKMDTIGCEEWESKDD